MKQKIPRSLILSFAVSFFATGIPYWLIPYREVNLPNALISPGLFILCIAALLLRFYNIASFWKITGIITATIPGIVIFRLLFEVLQDPTSHNLWPFEVIIAIIVGIACTLPGTLAGHLLAKISGHRNDIEIQ